MSDDSVAISKASGGRPMVSVESDSGSVNLNVRKDRSKHATRRPKRAQRRDPPRQATARPHVDTQPPPPDMNAFVNPRKEAVLSENDENDVETEAMSAGGLEDDEGYGDYGHADSGGAPGDSGYPSSTSSLETGPRSPYKSLREEREALLLKLFDLRKEGRDVPDVGFHTDIHELRFTYKRLEDDATTETGTALAKHALILGVGMLEMLNEQYNPFDLHLKHLSHDVMAAQKDLEPILKKLVQKYKTSMTAPPELSLVVALLTIGAGTHIRNTKKAEETQRQQVPVSRPQPTQTSIPQQKRPQMPPAPFAPGAMPGMLMPMAMPSRPNRDLQGPMPVPHAPPPQVPQVPTVIHEGDDSGSDIITEAMRPVLSPPAARSSSSASTASSSRSRTKRKRAKPAPPLNGKVVVI